MASDADRRELAELKARHSPSPANRDIESVLAWHTVRRAIVVGPIVVAIAWALRSWDGAWAAALGVLIVAGNFLLAGVIMSKAARISLSLYHAAALFGFFIRLGLIMASMFLIASLVEVDRPAMGIAAVASYLVLLSWEAFAVSKGAEKELEWTT